MTRSFDVFVDLCLNKRLSKQTVIWDAITLIMTSPGVEPLRIPYLFGQLREVTDAVVSDLKQLGGLILRLGQTVRQALKLREQFFTTQLGHATLWQRNTRKYNLQKKYSDQESV